MKFVKIQKNKEPVIECDELDNDVLVYRLNVEVSNHLQIKIKENQYAILIEQGKVNAVCNEVRNI